MSHAELQIVAQKDDLTVTIVPPPVANVEAVTSPDVVVMLAGNVGPPGPQGQWVALTQAEYDALIPPDPDTLYIIIE